MWFTFYEGKTFYFLRLELEKAAARGKPQKWKRFPTGSVLSSRRACKQINAPVLLYCVISEQYVTGHKMFHFACKQNNLILCPSKACDSTSNPQWHKFFARRSGIQVTLFWTTSSTLKISKAWQIWASEDTLNERLIYWKQEIPNTYNLLMTTNVQRSEEYSIWARKTVAIHVPWEKKSSKRPIAISDF